MVDVVLVVVVVEVMRTKLAVIVPGPFISAVVDCEVVLASDMDPVLVLHEENSYPLDGVATICSEEPALYQEVPDGVVVPLPLGELAIDTWYCVTKVIASLVCDGTLMEPDEADVTAYCVP